MNKQKGISSSLGILIVLLIAIVVGGIITWQMWPKRETSTPPPVVNSTPTSTPSSTPPTSPSPVSSSTQNLQNIATNLFSKHLESYQSNNVPLSSRLKKYTINSVTIGTVEDKCFRFVVNFSVETFKEENNGFTDWIAGNGEENGIWVNNKEMVVDVLKESNGYKIREMGTGTADPSCMGN